MIKDRNNTADNHRWVLVMSLIYEQNHLIDGIQGSDSEMKLVLE